MSETHYVPANMVDVLDEAWKERRSPGLRIERKLRHPDTGEPISPDHTSFAFRATKEDHRGDSHIAIADKIGISVTNYGGWTAADGERYVSFALWVTPTFDNKTGQVTGYTMVGRYGRVARRRNWWEKRRGAEKVHRHELRRAITNELGLMLQENPHLWDLASVARKLYLRRNAPTAPAVVNAASGSIPGYTEELLEKRDRIAVLAGLRHASGQPDELPDFATRLGDDNGIRLKTEAGEYIMRPAREKPLAGNDGRPTSFVLRATAADGLAARIKRTDYYSLNFDLQRGEDLVWRDGGGGQIWGQKRRGRFKVPNEHWRALYSDKVPVVAEAMRAMPPGLYVNEEIASLEEQCAWLENKLNELASIAAPPPNADKEPIAFTREECLALVSHPDDGLRLNGVLFLTCPTEPQAPVVDSAAEGSQAVGDSIQDASKPESPTEGAGERSGHKAAADGDREPEMPHDDGDREAREEGHAQSSSAMSRLERELDRIEQEQQALLDGITTEILPKEGGQYLLFPLDSNGAGEPDGARKSRRPALR